MQRAINMFTSHISSFFLRALFRVRPTEKVVKALTLADLESLARYDGTLPYNDPRVRALVWEVKYYAESHASKLAGDYLAQLLLAEASDVVGTPLLIPMPMHAKRRKERGHNQTEVLCVAALQSLGGFGSESKSRFKKVLGSPSAVFGQPSGQTIFAPTFTFATDILIRTRHTKPQQGLERHNRLKNLKDSMKVVYPELTCGEPVESVEGRVCIVVDDVSTTGASFAEAKRALKQAGASEVRCIALAQS